MEYNRIENKKTFDISALITAYYFFCKPSFVPCWEEYDFSQIFYIISGTGVYTTEKDSYPIREGMMIYRPAGKRSTYEWNTEHASFAVISFVCTSEAMSAFEIPPFTLNEDESAMLLDTIQTAAKVCESVKGNDAVTGMRLKDHVPDVVLGYIYASLERFLSMAYCRLKKIEPLFGYDCKVETFLREDKLIDEVKTYMRQHIEEKITLHQLCEEFWISPTALMKKFRNVTQKGVMEYCMEQKISEAKRRIGKNAKNVTEVAMSLGFSSTSYFSKVFKEKTGMTPTQYSKICVKRKL